MAAICTLRLLIRRKLDEVSFNFVARFFPNSFVPSLRSLLQWRSDPRLVRPDGTSHQAYPWPQDLASRSEDIEHFHDAKRTDQNRWLWHCARPIAHLWLRSNCHWHTLLSLARDLPREALQLEEWYLVPWLHPLRDGDTQACFRCKLHERLSPKNSAWQLPCYSKYLLRWS